MHKLFFFGCLWSLLWGSGRVILPTDAGVREQVTLALPGLCRWSQHESESAHSRPRLRLAVRGPFLRGGCGDPHSALIPTGCSAGTSAIEVGCEEEIAMQHYIAQSNCVAPSVQARNWAWMRSLNDSPRLRDFAMRAGRYTKKERRMRRSDCSMRCRAR